MRDHWKPIPWKVGGETRMDYQRSISGPAGCEIRLAAEEWQSRPGWWSARAALSSAVRLASRPRIKIQVKAPASAAARSALATFKSM